MVYLPDVDLSEGEVSACVWVYVWLGGLSDVDLGGVAALCMERVCWWVWVVFYLISISVRVELLPSVWVVGVYLPDVDLTEGGVGGLCAERVYRWVWVGGWVVGSLFI